MDEELSNAFTNYYKLKNEYEKSIIGKSVKKCVVCKKNGGSIFTRNKSKLKAICGSISPCNFNIEINRGMCQQLRDIISTTEEEYNYNRMDIIKNKLFHLYYDIDISDIPSKISDYHVISDYRNELYEKLDDILHNRKNAGTIIEKNGETMDILSSMKEKLELHSDGSSKIKEVIEVYKSILLPHLEEIRNLKYKYNEIAHIGSNNSHPLYEEGNIILAQRRYDIESTEIKLVDPSVISNIITK